jgi:small-conductance mechanosensitive channel
VSPFWQHLLIAVVVIVAASVVAKIVDWRIRQHDLAPGSATRYNVLRRAIFSTIVFVGVMSALLVIPQVRALAGGVLASSAVIGLVIGFASQRTIGNVVAGILIAITQPLRLGDEVEIEGTRGVVEEIGLTYTWIRTPGNDRLVVPNEKLASDTICNSTIVSRETLAQVTVEVPLDTDLDRIVDLVRAELAEERSPEVFVSSLDGQASIAARVWARDEFAAEQIEADLRLRIHRRLRESGLWANP